MHALLLEPSGLTARRLVPVPHFVETKSPWPQVINGTCISQTARSWYAHGGVAAGACVVPARTQVLSPTVATFEKCIMDATQCGMQQREVFSGRNSMYRVPYT